MTEKEATTTCKATTTTTHGSGRQAEAEGGSTGPIFNHPTVARRRPTRSDAEVYKRRIEEAGAEVENT